MRHLYEVGYVHVSVCLCVPMCACVYLSAWLSVSAGRSLNVTKYLWFETRLLIDRSLGHSTSPRWRQCAAATTICRTGPTELRGRRRASSVPTTLSSIWFLLCHRPPVIRRYQSAAAAAAATGRPACIFCRRINDGHSRSRYSVVKFHEIFFGLKYFRKGFSKYFGIFMN